MLDTLLHGCILNKTTGCMALQFTYNRDSTAAAISAQLQKPLAEDESEYARFALRAQATSDLYGALAHAEGQQGL